ncbi:hypothetical protein H2203_006795 [Taxawa tesnikishii (nom. ined.)]|nr:hypothetical protein H2203_006795 [Dothideales sp. JES 119]
MSWNTPGLEYAAPLASSQSPTSLPHAQPSPQTPNSVQPSRKRKKSENGDDEQQQQRGKHQPVKRACNECRQQKLKCNVVTEPELKPCSRCIKHHLHCAIDPGFRRQEKRQQHAEIEREGGFGPASSAFPGPNEAAASRSLLDLAQGFDSSYSGSASKEPTTHTLGRVALTDKEMSELFAIYFANYHPYLPLLSHDVTSTQLFSLHPLVYWAVIAVASRRYEARPTLLIELSQPLTDFVWSTVASVPQTYHVVKALCLLCAWPLPINSTSTDPSMTIAGVMVQLAMVFGLHRPSHAQDFSRYRIELREEDIKDRMNTWVAVNLMAQNVSTGYGMPQISRWNWYTHGLHLDRISTAFRNRCLIERFNDNITRTLYTMQRDDIVKVDEAQRALTIDMFTRQYEELEIVVRDSKPPPSPMDILYLHCAGLHLRLTALFDHPTAPNYRDDLSTLYVAASTLLKTFLATPSDATLPRTPILRSPFATNYIMQMILAAGSTLLKLLNSSFAAHLDIPVGRTLFLQTVQALRSISVVQNDLPQRLAEVLAQLWQDAGQGNQNARLFEGDGTKRQEIDSSLQLKVRCRMSMSLVYDSVWRWREKFGAHKNLDRAVEHPTSVEADGVGATLGAVNSASTGTGVQDVGALGGMGDMGMGTGMDGFDLGLGGMGGADAMFDPLGWFLDLPQYNPAEGGFAA